MGGGGRNQLVTAWRRTLRPTEGFYLPSVIPGKRGLGFRKIAEISKPLLRADWRCWNWPAWKPCLKLATSLSRQV